MKRAKLPKSEKGYALITVAASLLMLLGVAAYVVDLSAIRLDRAADQRITDAAASAGALSTFEESAVEGCEAALAYIAINTSGIDNLPDADCADPPPVGFDSSCSSEVPRELTIQNGRWNITIVNPVPEGHDFMKPGQIGASSYGTDEDGDPCERFGVAMTATHSSNFAQVIGSSQGATTVHSVAKAFLPGMDEPPINLLVLDRFGCDAILVEGNGGVIVNAVEDPASGQEFPGLTAADSDASSGCSPSVIRIEGSNAILRADGPPGCDEEVTEGTGEGCGLIQVLAPGTPGCNQPACTPGAGGANPPVPEPTALGERMTRRQIDHLYNCWGDYTWSTGMPGDVAWATDPLTTTNEQNIPPCEGSPDRHIYELIDKVEDSGSPLGYESWSADLGHPCNVVASDSVTESQSIHVDCAEFIVEGDVTIEGNVIFDGDVHVKSDGILEIQSSDGWAVFRDGRFKKDGQASLIIQRTAVYLSNTSWTDIAGGDHGRLFWTGPGGGNLKDLALWSDSPLTHFWAGQGELDMVGVFFIPLATAEYSGEGGQNQTEAQWIADKLRARGNAALNIQPLFDFPVKRDDSARTTLIR